MKKNKIADILKYIISFALIISGSLKIIGLDAYVKMILELSPNYYSNIYLLGVLAISSGILLLIPKTFMFGYISTLVFLGGTISAHMQHGDNYIPQIIFVILTAGIAYLKHREWFVGESLNK